MSMHLAHPALTTTGTRKGKKKWVSAEHKLQAEQAEDRWKELQKKWNLEDEDKKRRRGLSADTYSPPAQLYRGANDPKVPRKVITWDPCTKPNAKVYTGTKMLGIAQMAKSNAVPVFNSDHIIEIARMRR